jgi:hypothetical protein
MLDGSKADNDEVDRRLDNRCATNQGEVSQRVGGSEDDI